MDEVAPQETALLVLHYLREHSFTETARCFASEANALLSLVAPPAAGQRIRGLHSVLNEFVTLEARARERAAFERTFGDDGDVRSCLSKLGAVMDDYMASKARNRNALALKHARSTDAHTAGRPVLGEVSGSTAPPGRAGAAARMPPPLHAPERPVSRKRKSTQPQRRAADAGSLSSRQLFGLSTQPGSSTP
jgi:hypothetical protein